MPSTSLVLVLPVWMNQRCVLWLTPSPAVSSYIIVNGKGEPPHSRSSKLSFRLLNWSNLQNSLKVCHLFRMKWAELYVSWVYVCWALPEFWLYFLCKDNIPSPWEYTVSLQSKLSEEQRVGEEEFLDFIIELSNILATFLIAVVKHLARAT